MTMMVFEVSFIIFNEKISYFLKQAIQFPTAAREEDWPFSYPATPSNDG